MFTIPYLDNLIPPMSPYAKPRDFVPKQQLHVCYAAKKCFCDPSPIKEPRFRVNPNTLWIIYGELVAKTGMRADILLEVCALHTVYIFVCGFPFCHFVKEILRPAA